MQGQVQASNLSVANIYLGYVSILEETAKAISIMLWDLLNTEETNDIYIKLLGKENVDFIKYNKDITRSNYLTKVSVNIDSSDLQWINEMCITAVQQKQMTPDDALMVKKYSLFNVEHAIRYLTFIQKKRAKDAFKQQQQSAAQQQQATAQQQQQLMEQKAHEEAASDKREMIKTSTKINGEHMLKIQSLINDAVMESMKTGKPIPTYVQNAIDKQLAGHIVEQEQQIQALEEGLMQSDLQMMAAQQQQLQQQAAAQQQAHVAPQQQGAAA